MPREEDEFKLSYYNSMTTWIHIDAFLAQMGLTREHGYRVARRRSWKRSDPWRQTTHVRHT